MSQEEISELVKAIFVKKLVQPQICIVFLFICPPLNRKVSYECHWLKNFTSTFIPLVLKSSKIVPFELHLRQVPICLSQYPVNVLDTCPVGILQVTKSQVKNIRHKMYIRTQAKRIFEFLNYTDNYRKREAPSDY